MCVKKIETYQ